MGIPTRKIYGSFSGSKGYHVELFFGDTIKTDILFNLYRYIIEECCLDQKKVEFRPTDKAAIKLPLSVHPRTGKVCWFIEISSMEESCEPDYLLSIEPLDSREMQKLFSFSFSKPT